MADIALPRLAAAKGRGGAVGDYLFRHLTFLFALLVLLILCGVIVALVDAALVGGLATRGRAVAGVGPHRTAQRPAASPTARRSLVLGAGRAILAHSSDSGLDTRGRASAHHRWLPVMRFFVRGKRGPTRRSRRVGSASHPAGDCLLFASQTATGGGKPPANMCRGVSVHFASIAGECPAVAAYYGVWRRNGRNAGGGTRTPDTRIMIPLL